MSLIDIIEKNSFSMNLSHLFGYRNFPKEFFSLRDKKILLFPFDFLYMNILFIAKF